LNKVQKIIHIFTIHTYELYGIVSESESGSGLFLLKRLALWF